MGFFKKIGQAISGAAKNTRSAVSGATRKVLRRPAKEAAPAPAPAPEAPAAPPTPPAPPTAPAEAPPTPPAAPGLGGEEFGEEQAEAEEAEAEEEEEEEPRSYPDTLSISIYGDWKISENWWEGTIEADIPAHMIKTVVDLLDAGEDHAVAAIVGTFWDPDLAQRIDFEASVIHSISVS
ncbi:hypothetical protein ACIQWA_40615 [Kitasatospora sp. NPDC098652]|uniref:hypothetical protein n=1 Tax=Kitasatospora sp. NPDC098652 TaxID=3364095 RepID=UPI0038130873